MPDDLRWCALLGTVVHWEATLPLLPCSALIYCLNCRCRCHYLVKRTRTTFACPFITVIPVRFAVVPAFILPHACYHPFTARSAGGYLTLLIVTGDCGDCLSRAIARGAQWVVIIHVACRYARSAAIARVTPVRLRCI